MNRSLSAISILCAFAIAGSALAQTAGNTEAAPTLAASRLAPAGLMQGPYHRVSETVRFEGPIPRFEMQSKFGVFHVLGTEMLAIRVAELNAIESLNGVSKSAAFTDALKKSAIAPVGLATNLVENPGATVENIAAGAGSVFMRLGRVATTTAQRVGDTASDMSSTNKNAASSQGKATGEPEPPAFTGDPFGYNKARREWARKLNIDPYTTNPVLRPKLDDAARVSFAGSFAVETAVGMVAFGAVQYAVEFDSAVRDAAWNTPVIDLQTINEGKLKAMGIEGRVVRDFFRNRWFTPTLQTALVAALERLPGVRGRSAVIAAATRAQGESRARFLIRSVRLLSDHHQGGTRLSEITTSSLVPIGIAADRKLTIAAALDYLYWSDDVAAFVQRKELPAGNRTLLLSGSMSDRARTEFTRLGWTIRDRLAPRPAQ